MSPVGEEREPILSRSVVDRHQGDRRTRSLSCWDQLIALLFAQLTG
ncbi:MAG TPA: DUF4372 domain-containing protein, partial [Desulfobacterales bacterium]|nr:DUF4372 domain-containing protein [Desulfobacterales bacterium]